MRGKRAKALRRMARAMLLDRGINPDADANKYRQLQNCHAWVPDPGVRDPDGGSPMLRHTLAPGTALCLNPWRVLYRVLKRTLGGWGENG